VPWPGAGEPGFPVHPGTVGGWEDPFKMAVQLTLGALEALPNVRLLKDAVRYVALAARARS